MLCSSNNKSKKEREREDKENKTKQQQQQKEQRRCQIQCMVISLCVLMMCQGPDISKLYRSKWIRRAKLAFLMVKVCPNDRLYSFGSKMPSCFGVRIRCMRKQADQTRSREYPVLSGYTPPSNENKSAYLLGFMNQLFPGSIVVMLFRCFPRTSNHHMSVFQSYV